MTVIVLPGGQFAEKGLILNLPSDVQTVANQLPHDYRNMDLMAVHYLHQDKYEQVENINYSVRPAKLKDALIWLKQNNALYSEIKICTDELNRDQSNNTNENVTNFEFDNMEHCTVTPLDACIPFTNVSNFMQSKDSVIKIPIITENPVHVFEIENGEEMAYPWLFTNGKYGLNFPRAIKIPRAM